jgi:hemin uptake protein HemP
MDKSPTHIKGQATHTVGQMSASGKAINLKRLCSIELFSGARELVIEHAGDEYRLRQTNQGKLILTK